MHGIPATNCRIGPTQDLAASLYRLPVTFSNSCWSDGNYSRVGSASEGPKVRRRRLRHIAKEPVLLVWRLATFNSFGEKSPTSGPLIVSLS